MEEGIIIGSTAGVIWVTLFSDIWGRIKTVKLGIILGMLGVLTTLLGPIDWIRFLGLLLWGIGV